ncbi:4'-phosphopantetheine phosphatase-like isoform X1 [Pecten maximus]|uniref:4'-phosphopantetheine phosphatase-like isoform X1 n=2 Tax=Pecten maximus TaxID=6579 RepID=UPI0014587522|nr:4'-phosphopantetheine phosphatase-like isoform X1 [Pecten maximus]
MADNDNQRSYAVSISLPDEQVFRNLKNAKHFAIDIGGSLAKLAYSSTLQRRTSLVSEEFSEQEGAGCIYQVSEEDEFTNRLHFVKFETRLIETCLDFIQRHLKGSPLKDKVIKATGGGAHKYRHLINSKLGVQIDKEDEMQCLIQGCNFLLQNIPDEAFSYHRHEKPEYKFQGVNHNVFPYLLVNIGSGVSLIKVDSETNFERIGGTSNGGGTFWGLGSLLTKAKTFDELLELAEKGDHREVDMLVKDIYGGEYSSIGLTGDVIASSFGKATQPLKDQESCFREEDIARSLLLSISNDIGQIACLHARMHGLTKIYFGGYFIRGHPLTMRTITFAINFWSKDEIQPLFLRHEGYLGAIGAFLRGAEENDESGSQSYTWGENYARSSGLSSSQQSSNNWKRTRSSTFDMLELDKVNARDHCPVLLDPDTYNPDTVDLTKDPDAREYWLDCFSHTVDKTKGLAIRSQANSPDVKERANKFKDSYLDRLNGLKENPCAYGSLTVRFLLDTSSHLLRDFLFTDPYSQQKQTENEHALRSLSSRLKFLDSMSDTDRPLNLARGLLAGNVFDWGAKEVVKMMESGQEFGFSEALDKVEERPWLCDYFDAWRERLNRAPHRCAVVFCDNSGADIILGLFPFVRDLLIRGTKVILCANSRPTLNDVTYNELTILVKRVSEICPIIDKAVKEHQLMPMESGQESPCLDLRLVDQSLVKAMEREKADLIVIEGMGRAIHTNFDAKFSCESLKVAILKNKWLANRLGGEMFSVIYKYENPVSEDNRDKQC